MLIVDKRVCIPTERKYFNSISGALNLDLVQQLVADVKASSLVLLLVALVSIVLSFLIILALKSCAEFIVWSTILLFVVIMGFIGFLSFKFYRQIVTSPV